MKFYQTITRVFDSGRVVCSLTGVVDTDGFRPGSTYKELPAYDLYVDYFDTLREAEEFVESAKFA